MTTENGTFTFKYDGTYVTAHDSAMTWSYAGRLLTGKLDFYEVREVLKAIGHYAPFGCKSCYGNQLYVGYYQ